MTVQDDDGTYTTPVPEDADVGHMIWGLGKWTGFVTTGGKDAAVVTYQESGDQGVKLAAKLDYEVKNQYRYAILYHGPGPAHLSNLILVNMPVTNVDEDPAGAPVITGVFEEGETLTADTGSIGDPDGLNDPPGFAYQWIRVDSGTETAIPGATAATYTVQAADVGKALVVEVRFTDQGGFDETLRSAEFTGTIVTMVSTEAGTSPVIEGMPATFTVMASSPAPEGQTQDTARRPHGRRHDGGPLTDTIDGVKVAVLNYPTGVALRLAVVPEGAPSRTAPSGYRFLCGELLTPYGGAEGSPGVRFDGAAEQALMLRGRVRY